MPEEIKQEVVLKTQKYLGKYVKKPPLSEKLLKKPPFRFLHDVINAVIKETGFLKGLFSDEELNSDNVKDKDAKVAFLSKLIDAVKAITHTDLAVRPSKIVAGLQPTETNLLLQAIGKAIDKKVDSSEYVKQLQLGLIINNEKNKKIKKTTDKTEKTKKITKTEDKKDVSPSKKEKRSVIETPKSTDRDITKIKKSKDLKAKIDSVDAKSKNKEKPKKKEKGKDATDSLTKSSQPGNVIGSPSTIKAPNIDSNEKVNNSTLQTPENLHNSRSIIIQDDNINSTVDPATGAIAITSEAIDETNAENEQTRVKRSPSASRPKSARPKSGDLKDRPAQDDSIEPIQIQSRPKTSLRPPSVRPSSARPGAPRLRPDSGFPVKEVVPMGKINVIVENFDKDDDEETVIIQSNPEVVEDQSDNVNVPEENKGHLVEEILEQINDNDIKKANSTIDIDWQKDTLYGKDTTTKETTNLRMFIQSLTKTANPLGKLLNYLHEDIDAMQAELESWSHTKRQLFDEIAKQKKISAEMNKPLTSQLEHLNRDIKKIEEELANTRSNILRNDIRIKELLSK